MLKRISSRSWVVLTALAVIAAIAVIFPHFTSKAAAGLMVRTTSNNDNLPNYDIRTDKSARGTIESFRSISGKDASAVSLVRAGFKDGEAELKARVPSLKVDYNDDIQTPEVIGPDVTKGRNFLTSARSVVGGKHAPILIDFLKENASLVGADSTQIDELKVAADYTNPNGDLSFVELNQTINGIPVFRGEVKAGFTRAGEMVRVINNLAPGLDYNSVSTSFGDPMAAASYAATFTNQTLAKALTFDKAASTDIKVMFDKFDQVASAEKMYFPTEPGVAVPAWRVLIYDHIGAYYVIVDANSGAMLWRKNLTEDQTQSATYKVYTNPNAMMNVADNPFPITPGPVTLSGQQGAALPKSTVTIVGNEAPYTFNSNGWITDGANTTDGNNAQAALDRKLPNTGSPANPNDSDPDGVAVGSPNRVFDFPNTPGNPNTNTGDAPLPAGQTPTGCLAQANTDLPTDFQKASVSNLFYIVNRYHDELYTLGFTEAARNFQNDNFGRGGLGSDRVAAQGQDCSGTANANFTTPADGSRPTMQMYLWPGPTPDFDGDFDADVIVHEFTHGVSNRLHGNASGLTTNMSRGMGEGWGDFYGHSILSEPSDPINGVYTTGAYDTYLATGGFTTNAYYGIRRFPKSVITFTGGPNNRPHNPMTFADVDSTQFNISDGAFARGPFGSSTVDQVHNLGEIWSSTLWEVRARMVTRLGWAVGNRKTLQLVTDGMKLAPLGPTFLSERDAILAAAAASSLAPEASIDVGDVWAGFAARGMGASSSVTNAGTGANNTRVVEAFDSPNLAQTPNLTVSDTLGNNNGIAEPGETVTLTIPLTNATGNSATGVTLQLVGGGSANYGTITAGSTVSQDVTFTVPPATACGAVLSLTLNVNSSLGATSFTRSLPIGQAVTTFTENFDGVTAPSLPAGWTAVATQSGINFVNSTTAPDTAPNAMFAADPTSVGGGSDLTSPSMPITIPGALLTFRNKFDTEAGWDGGVLEISINSGSYQDIVTAGGAFLQNGYNGVLGAGANNPVANRNAWSGNSGGFVTTIVRLPASAAGQNVQFKFKFGGDDNTAATGWWVDSVQVAGNATCNAVNSVKSRADFDGDGKSDVSVFRSTTGDWYANRSTDGFQGIHWGATGDVIVPGDYDGDGKADFAIWRPSDTPNVTDFYVLYNSTFTIAGFSHGLTTDIPVAGDFDGDGKSDITVFRPSTGQWFVISSLAQTTLPAVQFGQTGDIPMAMDKDGDGKANFTVYRPSNFTFYMANAAGIPAEDFTSVQWGIAGDILVPADYDGDNKEDVAVYRPSLGDWYISKSTGGTSSIHFGQAGDIAVPGDYDGDGTDDIAVYRAGIWYMNRSTAGFAAVAFGTATDTPVEQKYHP